MAKSQCRILLKIFKILSINKQVKLEALEQAKKSSQKWRKFVIYRKLS